MITEAMIKAVECPMDEISVIFNHPDHWLKFKERNPMAVAILETSLTDINTTMPAHCPPLHTVEPDRLAYLEKRDIFLIELEHWLDIQIEVAKRQAKEQEHPMNEIIFNTKAKTLQEVFDKIKALEI